MIGAIIVALVPLVIIVGYVISKGAKALSWSFLTKDLPIITQFAGGGIAPAIVGTIVITGVAAIMAIPLGILAAVYLNEYGKNGKTARVIRFMADVMTGVPSIVMGLFVATIWVSGGLALRLLELRRLARARLFDAADRHPVVRGDAEARAERSAAGERRARRPPVAHRPVGRAAGRVCGGIVSGAMLAIARAAGETAPLLLTIGVTHTVNTSPFHGTNTTLSQEIWFNAQTPFAAAHNRAWGAALTLIFIVFVCTVAARLISSRFTLRSS